MTGKLGTIVVMISMVALLSACSGGGNASSTGINATLTSIAVTPANPSIAAGTNQQFQATGTYSDNTVKDLTASVEWSSSNTSVATISTVAASKGEVTAVSSGTTVITATSGSISGSTIATVTEILLSATTGVVATAGDGMVTLNWRGSADATSYNIYWATTAGVTKTTGTKVSGIVTPSYTHTGLTNGTTYYYVVTAQRNSTEGSESIEFKATPTNFISATIVSPAMGELIGKTVQIRLTASSFYQMQGISAEVDGRTAELVYSDTAICNKGMCRPGWVGTISLDGLARGDKLITTTVLDVFNNRSVSSRSFNYDQKPALTIAAPLNYTVGRPQLHIAATCADDDPVGCVSLKVTKDGSSTVIASGQTGIDETVSLSSFDGTSVTLRFAATDSVGQVTNEYRTVFVESSTRMVDLLSVSGSIWDVQPDRVLYLDSSTGGSALKVLDRSSGGISVVMNGVGIVPVYGYLTPKGAIFVAQSGSVLTSRVYDWRDGVLIDLGFPNSAISLKVKGNYAIWNQQPLLMMRNLVDGTDTTVTTQAGNWRDDVAANGDVVYWHDSTYQIYRYTNGVTSRLTDDALLRNVYPLTDGVNVIYLKQPYQLAIFTSSGESILTPVSSREPNPYTDYQVNDGWAAFTKPGTDGVLQIWLRAPNGGSTQLSFFGTSSSINALGLKGEVTWNSGSRLYLSKPGENPVDVGSSLGKSFYQGGQWYVTIGRSLFLLVP